MTSKARVPQVLNVRLGGRPVRAYTHLELSRRARWDAGWILTWAPEAATSAERSFLVSLIRGRGALGFDLLERVAAIKTRAVTFLDQMQREPGELPRRAGQASHARR